MSYTLIPSSLTLSSFSACAPSHHVQTALSVALVGGAVEAPAVVAEVEVAVVAEAEAEVVEL